MLVEIDKQKTTWDCEQMGDSALLKWPQGLDGLRGFEVRLWPNSDLWKNFREARCYNL